MNKKQKKGIVQKRNSYKILPVQLKKNIVKEIEEGKITRDQSLVKYGINSQTTLRSWLHLYGSTEYSERSDSPKNIEY